MACNIYSQILSTACFTLAGNCPRWGQQNGQNHQNGQKWAKPSLERLFCSDNDHGQKFNRGHSFSVIPNVWPHVEFCTNWHFVVCDRYSPQHDIPEPFKPQLHIYYKGAIEWKVEKKQASRKTKQPLSSDVEGLCSCLSTICQCGSNSGIMISLMIRDHLGLLCPVVLEGILRSIRGGARKTFPQFIIWEHRNKRQLEKKQRKRSRWLLCQTKTKLQLLIEIQL